MWFWRVGMLTLIIKICGHYWSAIHPTRYLVCIYSLQLTKFLPMWQFTWRNWMVKGPPGVSQFGRNLLLGRDLSQIGISWKWILFLKDTKQCKRVKLIIVQQCSSPDHGTDSSTQLLSILHSFQLCMGVPYLMILIQLLKTGRRGTAFKFWTHLI